MPLFRGNERAFAEAVCGLAYCNPFLPERIELERRALGSEFREARRDWNLEPAGQDPNVPLIHRRAAELVERLRDRPREHGGEGAAPDPREIELYEGLAIWVLYDRYAERLMAVLQRATDNPGSKPGRVECYAEFVRDAERLFSLPGQDMPARRELAHIFACYFQIRRAFVHTFHNIIGSSPSAARLRAAVWQSIFTHDMRRFRRTLYHRMGDLTTLVIGPSGTGKELVARAVGLSRYIPFDPASRTFTEDPAGSFYALNLAALSPTLIESELFGHRRGSFTGAIADRAGWLEVCRPLGTVFLDEIGDLDGAIQVKLLRVMQTRTFARIGDNKPIAFHGKVIAATNRDLAREMQAGRFRDDLYYRLCSDVIATPSLRERLSEDPAELGQLLHFLAGRIVGEEEAEALAKEVEAWVTGNLGAEYPWPGNVRELEQCVRNVLVRKAYRPAAVRGGAVANDDPAAALAGDVAAGSLTAETLLQRYCALIYARTGSYLETARRLGIDRRTVKDKIDGLRGEPPKDG